MRSNSLNAVDLNLLKVFAAIYNRRNLTHAGDMLAMTQPAVSRALDRLRAVFDDRLFQRVQGEMRPSRLAEMLAPLVFEGLERFEAALALNTDSRAQLSAANLRIGINDYLSIVVLPRILRQLEAHWPQAFLSTLPSTYHSAVEQVLREEVDCAIVSSVTPNARISTQPLFREDYVAVTSRHHPVCGSGLDLAAYLASRHLLVSYTGASTGWVDHKLEQLDCRRRIGAVVHLYAATPELLLAQPYICTVPRKLGERLATAYSLSVHELPFESEFHVFHLVWARHLTRNPMSMALRDQIVAACGELASPSPPGRPWPLNPLQSLPDEMAVHER